MGDKFTIYDNLKCAYCGVKQMEVYYAESSGFKTHKCEQCHCMNDIVMEFHLVQMPTPKVNKT